MYKKFIYPFFYNILIDCCLYIIIKNPNFNIIIIILGDEEPNSPNNPYQDQNGFLGSSYKGRIVPGNKLSYLHLYEKI